MQSGGVDLSDNVLFATIACHLAVNSSAQITIMDAIIRLTLIMCICGTWIVKNGLICHHIDTNITMPEVSVA